MHTMGRQVCAVLLRSTAPCAETRLLTLLMQSSGRWYAHRSASLDAVPGFDALHR